MKDFWVVGVLAIGTLAAVLWIVRQGVQPNSDAEFETHTAGLDSGITWHEVADAAEPNLIRFHGTTAQSSQTIQYRPQYIARQLDEGTIVGGFSLFYEMPTEDSMGHLEVRFNEHGYAIDAREVDLIARLTTILAHRPANPAPHDHTAMTDVAP